MFKKVPPILCLIAALITGCARDSSDTSAEEDPTGRLALLADESKSRKQVLGFEIEELNALANEAAEQTTRVEEVGGNEQSGGSRRTTAVEISPADVPPFPKMILVHGSYAVRDDVVIYSPDAVLAMGKGMLSSPTGIMVSNVEQTIFRGDLLVGNEENGIVQLTNGYFERGADGRWVGGSTGKGNYVWVPPGAIVEAEPGDAQSGEKPPGEERAPVGSAPAQ